ncbi:histidine kinase [Streptosporangium sp. NPDC020072]|uniref:sensor histidine kinase n=1 Tax=unclassified Streptosporangium TaxID=2632669 RepID=UPI003329A6F0
MRDVPVDPGAGLTNLRRSTWWSLIGVTVFFLALSVRSRIMDPAVPVAVRLAAVAALALTVTAVAVSVSRRLPRLPHGSPSVTTPVRWLVAGGAGSVMLGVILLALQDRGLWSFGPAMMVAITATFLSPRRRRLLIVTAAAGVAVLGGITGRGSVFAAAFPAGLMILSGWVTLGMLWAWDVAERLNAARRLSAELAVKDERLRFAAELHDIQGHHLQVIALKSELAARLAEADPSRAAAEMREVRRLAADALRDTRAVVQGYRRVTFEEEIANATRVLTSAGVDARTKLDPALPPGPGRHLLGLVVREATTNVLRHSHARYAEIEYRTADGLARLTVTNDGVSERPDADTGTGLRSLAERLPTAGGELTWRHDGDRFVVTARVPIEEM